MFVGLQPAASSTIGAQRLHCMTAARERSERTRSSRGRRTWWKWSLANAATLVAVLGDPGLSVLLKTPRAEAAGLTTSEVIEHDSLIVMSEHAVLEALWGPIDEDDRVVLDVVPATFETGDTWAVTVVVEQADDVGSISFDDHLIGPDVAGVQPPEHEELVGSGIFIPVERTAVFEERIERLAAGPTAVAATIEIEAVAGMLLGTSGVAPPVVAHLVSLTIRPTGDTELPAAEGSVRSATLLISGGSRSVVDAVELVRFLGELASNELSPPTYACRLRWRSAMMAKICHHTFGAPAR